MALVHVEDRRLEAEPAQHANAADPEHELLAHAVLAIAAVQRVRDVARPVGIALDLRVEEIERHAPDLHPPDAEPHRDELPVRVGHLDDRSHRHERERQPARVVARVALELAVVRVQPLPEVAATVVEADADERDAELGRRLEMVAGKDAETARVEGEALVEAELGREVRDEEVVGLATLVPPRDALALGLQPLLDVAQADGELRRQSAAEVVVGQLGEQRRRVVAELAEALRREVAEERSRARRPAEREVAGDLLERRAQGRSVVRLRHEGATLATCPTASL